jgi:rhomboid protease GluP
MDWSLVLVSQGIETHIDCSENGAGWGLVVAEPEYGKALRALRQYRVENRGWPWQQEVFRPGFLFDWGSLAWALLLVLFFWLDAHFDLHSPGFMFSTAVAKGQWWRLFTAMWLHADVGHLATNAIFGVLLLGFTMGRYGTGTGLLAAYLAGAGGNVMACLLSAGPHRSLGASGMVMGALGLLAAQSWGQPWCWPLSARLVRRSLAGVLGGIMLFILFGLTPGTDVLAHLGGFLTGLLFGMVLVCVPSGSARNSCGQVLSGLAFAILVVLPWWLAWR